MAKINMKKEPGGVYNFFRGAISSYTSTLLNLYISPTANCQLHTIYNAQAFISITKDEIEQIMGFIFYLTLDNDVFLEKGFNAPKLFLIDVKRSYYKAVLAKLAPYIQGHNEIEYISTNGSEMTINILKLGTTDENKKRLNPHKKVYYIKDSETLKYNKQMIYINQ